MHKKSSSYPELKFLIFLKSEIVMFDDHFQILNVLSFVLFSQT